MTDNHTLMLMEAAMCMWEQVVLNLIPRDNQWCEYVEGVGYGQLRLEIRDWAVDLERDWRKVEDTYDMCFDWDFVPEWMRDNLVFDENGDLTLKNMERDGAPALA